MHFQRTVAKTLRTKFKVKISLKFQIFKHDRDNCKITVIIFKNLFGRPKCEKVFSNIIIFRAHSAPVRKLISKNQFQSTRPHYNPAKQDWISMFIILARECVVNEFREAKFQPYSIWNRNPFARAAYNLGLIPAPARSNISPNRSILDHP